MRNCKSKSKFDPFIDCLHRFAKKTFKQSSEGKYWKRFKNVLMKRDDGGISIGDMTFCKHRETSSLMDRNQASSLLAVAVSVRVDIYKLVQPATDSEETNEIKPVS